MSDLPIPIPDVDLQALVSADELRNLLAAAYRAKGYEVREVRFHTKTDYALLPTDDPRDGGTARHTVTGCAVTLRPTVCPAPSSTP